MVGRVEWVFLYTTGVFWVLSSIEAEGDISGFVPASRDAGDDVVPVIGFCAADIDRFADGLDGVYEGEAVVVCFHHEHDAAMLATPIAVGRFDHH